MLFSATMTEEVANLIQLSLNCPVRLSADPSTKRPTTLSEEYGNQILNIYPVTCSSCVLWSLYLLSEPYVDVGTIFLLS